MNRTASGAVLVLLAGLGLGATYLAQHVTAARIENQRQAVENHRLLDLLPPSSFDNAPMQQPITLANPVLGHSQLLGAYRATREGRPVAVLLRTQVTGYAGAIELLLAIDANGRLLGVKTLRQTETPGLGARIAEWPNAWLQGFTGMSSTAPADKQWALKKDQGSFDQLAGATITSRAAIEAIHDGLRYFDEHRLALLGESTP